MTLKHLKFYEKPSQRHSACLAHTDAAASAASKAKPPSRLSNMIGVRVVGSRGRFIGIIEEVSAVVCG